MAHLESQTCKRMTAAHSDACGRRAARPGCPGRQGQQHGCEVVGGCQLHTVVVVWVAGRARSSRMAVQQCSRCSTTAHLGRHAVGAPEGRPLEAGKQRQLVHVLDDARQLSALLAHCSTADRQMGRRTGTGTGRVRDTSENCWRYRLPTATQTAELPSLQRQANDTPSHPPTPRPHPLPHLP